MSNLFSDGTFSVVRNSEFNQIYIFSKNITNSANTRCFSYPLLMFLMKKRTKNSYIEILEFIKKIYREKCGQELSLKSIHSDAEYSFLSAMQEIFPRTNIFLCSVQNSKSDSKKFQIKSFRNF